MSTEHPLRAPFVVLGKLIKVTILLVMGALLQKFVPMTRWGHLLGTPGRPDLVTAEPAPAPAPTEVLALEKSLRQGARLLPFTPSCLAQAFAGQRMLISLGIPGTVTIGLRQEGTSNWPAHAWLHAGDRVITGAGVGDVYFPTTSYRSPSPRLTPNHHGVSDSE